MKNTIIALAASAIALGSVNAQSVNFSVDPAFSVGDTTVQWSVLGSDGVSSGTLTATTNISGGFQAAGATFASVTTFERRGSVSYTYSGSAIDTNTIEGFIGDLGGDLGNFAVTSGTVTSNVGGFTNSQTGATLAVGTNLSGLQITDPDGGGRLIIGSDFGFNVGYRGISDTEGGFVITATRFDLNAVPEPSSALLLGLGAFGLLGRRKR